MHTVPPPARADVAFWVRRLATAIILVTCAGGAVFVLIGRPYGNCVVVADMMATYSAFQSESSSALVSGGSERDSLLAVADAEARTGATLHRQAAQITLPRLRTAAAAFAEGVAQSARDQRADIETPDELEPFQAALPELDAAQLKDAETFFASAHILLSACPAAPHPIGLT